MLKVIIEEIKENKEGIEIKANNNENNDVIQKKAGKKGKKRKSKVSHKKEKEKENENDVIKIEDINLEENINIEKKPTDKIRKIKNKTLISKSSMPSESKEDTLNTADKSVEEKGNMLEKTGKKGGKKKGKLLSKSSRPKDNQVELLISDYTEEDKKDMPSYIKIGKWIKKNIKYVLTYVGLNDITATEIIQEKIVKIKVFQNLKILQKKKQNQNILRMIKEVISHRYMIMVQMN